jgi:hypothetical protein
MVEVNTTILLQEVEKLKKDLRQQKKEREKEQA